MLKAINGEGDFEQEDTGNAMGAWRECKLRVQGVTPRGTRVPRTAVPGFESWLGFQV